MSHLPRRCRALLIALGCDALVGELPNQLHPVVWMGGWLKSGARLAPGGDATRLGWGAAWLASGAALAAGVAALVPAHQLARGAAASTLLAYRALDRALGEVQAALEQDNLGEARPLYARRWSARPRHGDEGRGAEDRARGAGAARGRAGDWWSIVPRRGEEAETRRPEGAKR